MAGKGRTNMHKILSILRNAQSCVLLALSQKNSSDCVCVFSRNSKRWPIILCAASAATCFPEFVSIEGQFKIGNEWNLIALRPQSEDDGFEEEIHISRAVIWKGVALATTGGMHLALSLSLFVVIFRPGERATLIFICRRSQKPCTEFNHDDCMQFSHSNIWHRQSCISIRAILRAFLSRHPFCRTKYWVIRSKRWKIFWRFGKSFSFDGIVAWLVAEPMFYETGPLFELNFIAGLFFLCERFS